MKGIPVVFVSVLAASFLAHLGVALPRNFQRESSDLEGTYCSPLTAPANGKIVSSLGNVSKPGMVVHFQCMEKDYELIGSAVRVCKKDGSWSGSQPQCRYRKQVVKRHSVIMASRQRMCRRKGFTCGGDVDCCGTLFCLQSLLFVNRCCDNRDYFDDDWDCYLQYNLLDKEVAERMDVDWDLY